MYIFKLTKEWLKLPYGKIPVTWGCLLHMAQIHQTVTKETASNSSNHEGRTHSLETLQILRIYLYLFFFLNSSFTLPAHHLCHAGWSPPLPPLKSPRSAQHHLVRTWQRNHMNNHYHGRPASALKPWNSYKQQKNINDKHRCRVHRSFPSPSQQEMWDHIKNRTDTCN